MMSVTQKSKKPPVIIGTATNFYEVCGNNSSYLISDLHDNIDVPINCNTQFRYL